MPAWSRLTTKSRIPEYLLCTKQKPADVHFHQGRSARYDKAPDMLLKALLTNLIVIRALVFPGIMVVNLDEGSITFFSTVKSSPTETRYCRGLGLVTMIARFSCWS